MVAELARAWVDGWVVSRGAPPAVEEPWGLRVDVRLPGHVARHVLPETDEAAVRMAAGAIRTPGVWIKGFRAPELVAGWLDDRWEASPPTFLMATELRRAPAHAPEGYRCVSGTAAGVTRVRVLAPDGAVAAYGQVAPTGGTAVVDQVATDPAHRRRGLGSLVLRTLANTAVDQGAALGLLGASVEGRALYESLGWSVRAPLAGFVYRSTAAG